MHNRKYNTKKKVNNSNLINFKDFLKYRSDKQKIITVTLTHIKNPFEENWKKAIVFQELLELYKPHENNYLPSNASYDRKDFQNFYKHKANIDLEDSMWENNEDYQLNKLYKMAEGVNNFEEAFQNHKITKTAENIQIRSNHHLATHYVPSPIQSISKKMNQKTAKKNKIYFRKESLKEFESFINFKEKPRKSFLTWKDKIQKLQKKAVDQYGVNFPKQDNGNYQSVDYAQFKEREAAIFQKFIRLQTAQPKKASQSTQKAQLSKDIFADVISSVPSTIFNNCMRPNTSCPSSPVKIFKEGVQARKLARKKYIRIPGGV